MSVGPLVLDASHGEGGGQVLRTALTLAAVLGRPVDLQGIRLRRPRPGLQPQHQTVVRALAAITDAEVSGAALGSTALRFAPRGLRGGEYRFDVGAVAPSAGSVSLLFQALLLPLAFAGGPSRLVLVGGTHVPWSPPFHYLADVFLPVLREVGIDAAVELRRWGWYPAGGGEVVATVRPGAPRGGLTAMAPPDPRLIRGLSAVSRLHRSIAERQCRQARARLQDAGLSVELAVEEDRTALGPGTLLFLAAAGRAGFSALGRRGIPAERIADEAVDALLGWRASGAALDSHLADQLVPFLALARRPSAFTCPVLSSHLQTVGWLVEQFLEVAVKLHPEAPPRVEVVPADR